MIVRHLTEQDGEIVWQLRLQALQDNPEAFGGTYEETIARGFDRYVQWLQQGKDTFWLGAFEDKLIGMVGVIRETGLKSQHKGYIIGMYVLPDARGKGAGKALLQEAIAHAHTMAGLDQLHLAVVTTNDAARNLYRSLGFEVYGVEPRALKANGQYWDEELMILRLK